jgi:hypothetical protein
MMRKTFPSDCVPRSRPEVRSIFVPPEVHATITSKARSQGLNCRAFCDRELTRILDEIGAPREMPTVPITAAIAGSVWMRAKRSSRTRSEVFEADLLRALDKAGAP